MTAVCVDDPLAASRIAGLMRSEFPEVQLYVRSYDRAHTLELIATGVDYQLRETYESALAFGREALVGLGLDPERATDIAADVRERDLARLVAQQAEGIHAGTDMLHRTPVPTPLTVPRRSAEPLNFEAGELIRREKDASSPP